jgi:hypothetical protein
MPTRHPITATLRRMLTIAIAAPRSFSKCQNDAAPHRLISCRTGGRRHARREIPGDVLGALDVIGAGRE